MSIFPKNARPGGRVTIHLCLMAPDTDVRLSSLRLSVVDPGGRRYSLFDGLLAQLPEAPLPRDEQVAPGSSLRRLQPLHVLAAYGKSAARRRVLGDLLARGDRGTHRYFVFDVPEDAPLGKWHVDSERLVAGRRLPSVTAEEDFFWVEDLRLDELVAAPGSGWRVTIANPSGEPLELALYRQSPLEARPELLSLAGGCARTLELETVPAFLVWSEGRAITPLVPDDARLVVRNPELAALEDRDGEVDVVYVIAAEQDEAYRLDGDARTLWLAADGLALESALRCGGREAVFDEMAASGLLLMLDPAELC